MKNLIRCFTVFSLLILLADFSKGQSVNDTAIVLQKCIDLPVLQQYLQNTTGAQPQQLYIMQHGVSFQPDITVSKDGVPLVYMMKQEIYENDVEAYFLFWTFEIAQNLAKVEFIYNYKNSDNSTKSILIDLELQKAEDSWNIIQSKVENR